MSLDRRTFLKSVAGAAAFGGPFAGFVARAAGQVPLPGGLLPGTPPSAPLAPVADLRDGIVRLHLPPGFAYRSFHDTTAPVVLGDQTPLPGRHDGMAAFAGPSGRTILIRNHEVNGPVPTFSAAAPVYDPMTGGGTTTVDVSADGVVADSWASLAGTQNNCAGGRMPWGTWLTCEETVNGPDVGPDFTTAPNIALTKPHGFIFEVPASGKATAVPIRSAGRFLHEAAAWDPEGKALYLTEDNFSFPSGLYRYLPPSDPAITRRLADGGRLQMLKVRGMPQADLAAAQPRGASYKVEWVDIADPAPTFPYTPGQVAPTSNNTASTYVSNQGLAQGAARFSRLEGCVYDAGVVYFTSTQGGGVAGGGPNPVVDGWCTGFGQIWAYEIALGRLRLVYQSPGRQVLDFPDNVTASRRGTLVLCEDHDQDNYLRGLTPEGRIFDIAVNRIAGRTGDEFAGAAFSRDDGTLFVNIQASRGMTFAIWGPWRSIGV